MIEVYLQVYIAKKCDQQMLFANMMRVAHHFSNFYAIITYLNE